MQEWKCKSICHRRALWVLWCHFSNWHYKFWSKYPRVLQYQGTIVNENTLVSKAEILSKSKEVSILTAVTITNATYVIKSNHLDYYTNSGHSYLFGPSTITSKPIIFIRKGFMILKKSCPFSTEILYQIRRPTNQRRQLILWSK
jgi:hypothetical protein